MRNSRIGTPWSLQANTSTGSFSESVDAFIPASDCDALLRPGRLYGIELPTTLFDAPGALVPGNRGADMVWASALACSGDFLLRLAGCQGKNLIVEARCVAAAGSRLCSRIAPASAHSR